jgi:hypothetical protein
MLIWRDSFVQVFIESLERLLSKDLETVVISTNGVIVMAVTVAVKLLVNFGIS